MATASLSIPPTQNTAPVIEFRCLYTHDLRRKSKRWQDGVLRFHTFNKRVMVYDVARNFVGDTHWKEDASVQEGDELELNEGVLVEIAEAVGVTQTDLTGLFERKTRPSLGGRNPASSPASSVGIRSSPQLRHKSLNTLLGTPIGPPNKAILPSISPYEERLDKENKWENGRAAKRQKALSNGASAAEHLSSPVRIPQKEPQGISPYEIRRHNDKERGDGSSNLKQKPVSNAARITQLAQNPKPVASQFQIPPKRPPNKALLSTYEQGNFQEKGQGRSRPGNQQKFLSTSISSIGTSIDPANRPKHQASPIPNPRAKALRLPSGRGKSTLLCQPASHRCPTTSHTHTATSEDPNAKLFDPMDWSFPKLPKNKSVNKNANTTSNLAATFRTPQETSAQRQAALPSLPKSKASNTNTIMEMNSAPKPPPTAHRTKFNPATSVCRISLSSSPGEFEPMTLVHSRTDQRLLTTIPNPASHQPTRLQNAIKKPQPLPVAKSAASSLDTSSSRLFCRIRSALDTPISSTAKQWEQQNTSHSKSKAKPSPTRNMQRSKDFDSGSALAEDTRPPLSPIESDLGPWSAEALDLLDWRPPL